MIATIELTEKDLKRLIIKEFQRLVKDMPVGEEDIRFVCYGNTLNHASIALELPDEGLRLVKE